ncbi:MAG: glycosyltransferase, partial [Clostridium sp.]
MIKVSIVLPIFNVENYLEECLESIVNQTLDKFEVIAINDGSTDKSLEILKIYASKYNFIKIINKQNNGLSVARNNGLKYAKGEYVYF